MTNINWSRIGEAVKKYQELGYEYIEVPWVVPFKDVHITLPRDKCAMEITDHYFSEMDYPVLVGSGEQSLLSLRHQLKPNHKYVCVTPCFRDEDVYDELHQPYFVKVELMTVLPRAGNLVDVKSVSDDARLVMHLFAQKPITYRVEGSLQLDLFLNDIEVGSYGYREHEGFKWVYGTGLAEPRFSLALSKGKFEGILDTASLKELNNHYDQMSSSVSESKVEVQSDMKPVSLKGNRMVDVLTDVFGRDWKEIKENTFFPRSVVEKALMDDDVAEVVITPGGMITFGGEGYIITVGNVGAKNLTIKNPHCLIQKPQSPSPSFDSYSVHTGEIKI